jgi:ankyrin repeat protein
MIPTRIIPFVIAIFLLFNAQNACADTIRTLVKEFMSSSYTVDIERAKQLINQSSDLNEKDQEGNTALYLAAGMGYIDIVKLLIQAGADVNAVCYRGQTALTCATANGFTDIVKILLKSGAQVNFEDKKRPNVLFIAVQRSDINLMKLFLSYGADIRAKDENGWDLLTFARIADERNKVSQEMIDFLNNEFNKFSK